MVQHPSNGLYMLIAFALGLDKDVIRVHYYENVERFCQDLDDVALKRFQHIGQSKRHDLIFEVTIAGLKGYLPCIAFPDPHLMVGISQIELGETSSMTYSIQWFSDQRQGISILDNQIIETLVIHA